MRCPFIEHRNSLKVLTLRFEIKKIATSHKTNCDAGWWQRSWFKAWRLRIALFSRAVSSSQFSYIIICSTFRKFHLLFDCSSSLQNFRFVGTLINLAGDNMKKRTRIKRVLIRLMATIYFLGPSPAKYRRRVRA